jgi:hypothetical protein
VADGGVEDLDADVGRFQGPELERIHLQVSVLTGDDPGYSVGFLDGGSGVEGVINFLLH